MITAGDRIRIFEDEPNGENLGTWIVTSVYVEGLWAYQDGGSSTPIWFARAIYRWERDTSTNRA